MSPYDREEALAFVDAMRLAIEGKVGFSWHAERLGALRDYIEELSAENETLNEFLDRSHMREQYEAHVRQHIDTGHS